MKNWKQLSLCQCNSRPLKHILATGSLILLAACGGGGGGTNSHALNVQVSGLQAQQSIQLVNTLALDKTELLTVVENGTHTFKTLISHNGSYSVTTANTGGLNCTVTNGADTHITTTPPPVLVNCLNSDDATAYSVGGEVFGLGASQSFQIKLFEGDTPIPVVQSGPYQFNTKIAPGGNYRIQVVTQPDGLYCAPVNGARWDVQTNITDENINCRPAGAEWRVSVNVTGLDADNTLTVANQRKGQPDDVLTFVSDETQPFAQPVVDGGDYNVAITNIAQPDQQTCNITSGNGSGKAVANVTVQITCEDITAPLYPITARVVGLYEGNELLLKEDEIGQWLALTPQNPEKPFFYQQEQGKRYSVSFANSVTAQSCEFVNNSNTGTVNGPVMVEVLCGQPNVTTIYSTPSDIREYLGYPVGLIKGKDEGIFYGITTKDVVPIIDDPKISLNRSGSLFQMDTAGNLTQLGLFAGSSCIANDSGAGGLYPSAPTGVIQTTNGSLLGMTYAGALAGVDSIKGYDCSPTNGDLYGNTLFRGAVFSYANNIYNQFVYQIGRDIIAPNNPAQNAGPVGGLIQDSMGNVYGVTYGAIFTNDLSFTHVGTVFKWTPNGTGGTWTPLKVFNVSDWNGFFPGGRLMLDGNYLYGTTERGGVNDAGTVFRINLASNNSYEVIYHFEAASELYIRPAIGDSWYRDPYANRYSALVKGSDNNLYGVRRDGGANQAGAIYRLLPTEDSGFIPEVLYSFPADNGTPVSELIEINGMFYGVNQGEKSAGTGSTLMGSIYRFDPQTRSVVTLHSFKGSQEGGDGNVPNTGLLLGSDGQSLYGTTKFGGKNSTGAIYKLSW